MTVWPTRKKGRVDNGGVDNGGGDVLLVRLVVDGGGDHGGRQCGGRQGKISSHVRDSICARRDGSVEGWMTDNVRRRLATSIRRPQH